MIHASYMIHVRRCADSTPPSTIKRNRTSPLLARFPTRLGSLFLFLVVCVSIMVHGDYAIAIIRVSGFQVAEPEPDICFEVGVFDFKTPNSKPGQLTPTPQVSAYKELGSKMWGFQRSSKIPPALLGFCRVLEYLQNLKKANLEPETLDDKSRGNTSGLPGFTIYEIINFDNLRT